MPLVPAKDGVPQVVAPGAKATQVPVPAFIKVGGVVVLLIQYNF